MSPDPTGADFPSPPGYAFLERIATSGFSEVYRARELVLDRDVAIEVFHVNRPWAEGTNRFVDAVRIQASLQHPGIPQVHHAGALPDGQPFAVMNLIRGPYLTTLIPAARDTRRLVDIFRQACEALGYAHARGVVHRDVKTRNVMIGERGEVYLTSWGLAFTPAELTQEVLARNPDLVGSVVGTPAFMPPEQARGEQADERSDVFGLGGILCHILTGGPPFRPDDLGALIQVSAAGDLHDAFARLDACGANAEIVALCKRCLDPNPCEPSGRWNRGRSTRRAGL